MGYLRFCFCITVLFTHFFYDSIAGPIAVFGLFILSGFVTAHVTTTIYNHGYRSKILYLANRFIRIYPIYLFSLLFSVTSIRFMGFSEFNDHWHIVIPANAIDWLKEFTIIGLSDFTPRIDRPRLVFTAWSLSTEIIYYFIIGAVLGGRKKATFICFLIIVLLTIVAMLFGASFKELCYTAPGPAVVFFWGATCYYFQDCIKKYRIQNTQLLLVILSLTLFFPTLFVPNDSELSDIIALFLVFPVLGWLIISFFNRTSQPSKFEQWLGDLSYPCFLLQFSVASLAHYFIPSLTQPHTLPFFLVTASFCILLSIILVITIETPLKKYRELIRKKAQ